MNTLSRQSWLGTAILIGVLYFLIGFLLGLPSSHVRFWRLAAWIACAAVYAAHISYEHFRLRNSPRAVALHAAFAVAVGAFGLAVAANVHELSLDTTYRPSLALAFVAWPLLTAVPAFVVSLIIAYGLALTRRRSTAS